MPCCILLYVLLARVRIAINTEMPACVIHADILAHHATTDFALPFVFQILLVCRNVENPSKRIRLGQLTCV